MILNLKRIKSHHFIFIIALFFILFDNFRLFSNILQVYPVNLKNIAFLISLVWIFFSIITLSLSILGVKYLLKPVVILLLLVSSVAGYFMDSYNIVIDSSMIQNIISTDINESKDLLNFRLVIYFILLGALPAYWVYKTNIIFQPFLKELISRLKIIFFLLITSAVMVFILSDFYSSFIREHKILRYYANPIHYLYSIVKFIKLNSSSEPQEIKKTGLDAHVINPNPPHKLVIFVVGETARADRFSLNGYSRQTNPLLSQEDVISYSNFWSCGTSTAVSVPCMFSIYDESEFKISKAKETENVLDVLKHAGVSTLWLDNNSSSKGVADRIEHQDYKSDKVNPVCDTECRDIGMLSHLQEYINQHQDNNVLIVLHQMGQHGPAYYKRYPKAFEKFKPVCKTNQLENCTLEELNNAYDNAILYTDYFLSEVIKLLKQNDTNFQTAMLYVSDHGESLGENGLYLHGLPNLFAPDTQRHVPVILWVGENNTAIDKKHLLKNKDQKYSHDNIFDTILGLLGVETSVYHKNKDIAAVK